MSEEAKEDVTQIVTPVRCEYLYTPGTASTKFLRGLEKGKLMGQKCDQCGKVYIPPRGACARCGVPTNEEVELAHKGTDHHVLHRGARPLREHRRSSCPIAPASILLDGADISMNGLILQECETSRTCANRHAGRGGLEDPSPSGRTGMANIKHFRPIDEPDVPFEQIKEYSLMRDVAVIVGYAQTPVRPNRSRIKQRSRDADAGDRRRWYEKSGYPEAEEIGFTCSGSYRLPRWTVVLAS